MDDARAEFLHKEILPLDLTGQSTRIWDSLGAVYHEQAVNHRELFERSRFLRYDVDP